MYQNFDNLKNFEDGTFDLIFSNDALYHAMDHVNIGREMGRLLREDGVAIFSDLLVLKGKDNK
jgi:SAM-dependent methyltransferase